MRTKILIVAGLLVIGTLVHADTTFNTQNEYTSDQLTANGGTLVDGSLTESAYWANVYDSSTTTTPAYTFTGTGTNTGSTLEQAELGYYTGNGLGVCNGNEQTACASPQHQIDNYTGLDFVLLNFNTAVSLKSIQVASYGNPTGSGSDDVDLSYAILSASQYTSLTTTGPGLSLTNITFTNLSTSDLASNTYSLTGSGQYVLVGASIAPYYGDGSLANATKDAFKIQDVTIASSTPEPASFLLLGSGLLAGVFFARRRKSQNSNA